MSEHEISLIVNGRPRRGRAPALPPLVDFLRDDLRLTGTHAGCEHGVCGACSVLLDGRAIRSCLMFAVQADGAQITTVEGLAPEPGALSVLQDCFWEVHALQCGFCTPGMLISLAVFLGEQPDADEAAIRDAISGNLCRCTGYESIVEAGLQAGRALRRET